MSPVASNDRFVCPPWYECPCPLGLPVSRTTMLNHRRNANSRRQSMGRGNFAWGPRVPDDLTGSYVFTSFDSLEDHLTDCEDTPRSSRPRGRRAPRTRQRTTEANNLRDDIPSTPIAPPTLPVIHESATLTPAGEHVTDTVHISDPHQSHTTGTTTVPSAAGPVIDSNYGTLGSSTDVAHVTHNEQMENDDGFVVAEMEDPSDLNDLEMDPSTSIECLKDWLRQNQGVVDLYIKHGLEQSVMDDILALLHAPCKVWKTVIRFINDSSVLSSKTETHAVCPGHCSFAVFSEEPQLTSHCSTCGKMKPADLAQTEAKVSYLPIMPRIAAMVRDQTICAQLYSYRHERSSEPDRIRDFFDSDLYRTLVSRYSEEALQWDIFIAVSADGFQPYRNKRNDVWSVIGILYNLSPSIRYATKNVIPMMFIPVPKEPKDLESFFIPLLNEVSRTHVCNGYSLLFHDGSTRRVRIHLIWFQGDTPAVSKAAGLCGHRAKYPCRSCIVEGVYVADRKGHYYPSRVSSLPNQNGPNQVYNPRSLKPRTHSMISEAFQRLELSRSQTQRSAIATSTGIKRRSLLLRIPNFVPFKSFPHDTMHLFYNIQRELLSLLTGDVDDFFSLNKSSIDAIDCEIFDAGHTISGQLIQRRPQALSAWSSWKAIEHRKFSMYMCIIVLDGHLPREYLDGFATLAELVDISCRAELSEADVVRIGVLSLRFLEHFEKCYYQFRQDRIHFCKSQFHMLLHLEETIRQCGPLLCTSQYVMERSIGYQVERLNAKVLASESLFKSALFTESYRLFYKIPFHEGNETYRTVASEGSFTFLGPSERTRLLEYERLSSLENKLVQYFLRKYDGMELSQAKAIVAVVGRIEAFTRVQLVSGSATQTVSARKFVSVSSTDGDPRRLSCYFAAEMDETESRSDIYYGILQDVLEFDLTDAAPIAEVQTFPWRAKYQLVIADWAKRLRKGFQRQVFFQGKVKDCFSGTTVEDASVIKRLVGIMEHTVPSDSQARGNASQSRNPSNQPSARRGRRLTYIIDTLIATDHLLSDEESLDGVNRRLKGLIR